MSDTPRTDACEVRFSTLFAGEDAMWVPSKKAKEIERELNAANTKIEGLRAVVTRFEEVPENTEKADLVQSCKNLTIQLNAANERIKRLEEAGDAMMFWCADEVSLEQWNFAKQ